MKLSQRAVFNDPSWFSSAHPRPRRSFLLLDSLPVWRMAWSSSALFLNVYPISPASIDPAARPFSTDLTISRYFWRYSFLAILYSATASEIGFQMYFLNGPSNLPPSIASTQDSTLRIAALAPINMILRLSQSDIALSYPRRSFFVSITPTLSTNSATIRFLSTILPSISICLFLRDRCHKAWICSDKSVN